MQETENKQGLYNPLEEDFSCTYDSNNDKNPVTYTVPAMSVAFFEPQLAEHIAKHLCTAVMDTRSVKTNYPQEYEDCLKNEILVKI